MCSNDAAITSTLIATYKSTDNSANWATVDTTNL